MWRLNKVRHKAGRQGDNSEEFRLRRREQEKSLRQARRDQQLVSKRLLLNDDEEHPDVSMETTPVPQDVVGLLLKLQRGGSEKQQQLEDLSRALRDPTAQVAFTRHQSGVPLLVGLLSGSSSPLRLLAARCLHHLSLSPHRGVASACLPASSYLLTYLSGPSSRFTELCLYTLGNLCPDSDAVTEQLVAQGIIPALDGCMETQRYNLAVMEAAGFTLSQLLQTKCAAEKIIPLVLSSGLPVHLLSVLTPDPQFGLAPAIECAWCLHYLTSSPQGNSGLLSLGALSQCSSLLVSLGGAVAEGNTDEGLELLLCPLLRCTGNLASCCPLDVLSSQTGGAALLVSLCSLLQTVLPRRPGLARETAWVINNLTAHSSEFCSALLTHHLVPGLIRLLPFSQGINTMILRILANAAHQRSPLCVQLVAAGLLPALCATLKMAEPEVVLLSLELLFLLLVTSPQAADVFISEGGVPLLEAVQFNGDTGMRRRAAHLLEQHLLPAVSLASANGPS